MEISKHATLNSLEQASKQTNKQKDKQTNKQTKKHTNYLKFYRNDENMGAWHSSNKGAKIATGEYIYFCAEDDRVCSGFFEKSVKNDFCGILGYSGGGHLQKIHRCIDPDDIFDFQKFDFSFFRFFLFVNF